MQFFDVHCHLQDERYGESLDKVLARAREAGVERMLCCGTCPADWDNVRKLCGKYECLVPSFGLHPWYIEEAGEGWEDRLREKLLETPSGVGEIGLDFAIENAEREKQEACVRIQIRIANALNRPVSFHCRKAWERCVAIVREEGLRRGGVVHAYSGSAETVPVLERLGLFVSFAATLTRPRNRRVHRSVAAVSPDRLLLETDSPDLLPHDAGMALNEPSNIVHAARAASMHRNEPLERTVSLAYANAFRLFEGIMK